MVNIFGTGIAKKNFLNIQNIFTKSKNNLISILPKVINLSIGDIIVIIVWHNFIRPWHKGIKNFGCINFDIALTASPMAPFKNLSAKSIAPATVDKFWTLIQTVLISSIVFIAFATSSLGKFLISVYLLNIEKALVK